MIHKSLASCAIGACILQAASANAQNTQAATQAPPQASNDQTGQLEDIVVTAQKRSENLQNVPIAVTAVTSSQLSKSNAAGVLDLQTVVPSLKVTNSVARLSLSLRGIGTNAFGPGIENPIAIYVDGVYYASTAASILSFNNIAQIEVLKGPQGTLFGRNATGGLLQVRTKDPTTDLSGDLDLSYSRFNAVTGNFYIASGLADGVAADLAVHVSHQGDGWGKDPLTGHDPYQVLHDVGVRSKWVLTPGSRTKITIIADYSDTRDSLSANIIRPGSISPFAPGLQPDRKYDLLADIRPLHTLRDGGISARIEQELGDAKLTSITAYRRSKTFLQLDLDGLPQRIQNFYDRQNDQQISEELQLSSDNTSRLKWTGGVYFIDSTARYLPLFVELRDLGISASTSDKSQAISVAGYGQATYAVTSNTNVTVGGRYTYEKRKELDATQLVTVLAPGLQLPAAFPDRSATFKKVTWRFSIDHRFSSEVLAYASVNRGFKSGGFNISTPGAEPFRPETLDAYEVGLKTDLLDRHLRVNVAGFYYDYKDVQVPKYVSGSIAIINGAKARSYGADADITAVLSDRFSLVASASVLSSTYRDFPGCPISAPLGGVPITEGSCKGNHLPLAAKLTTSLAADYTVPLGDGKLSFNGNILYNDGYPLDSDNVIKQRHYAQLGSSVRWTPGAGSFSLTGFVKNLTNKRVYTYGASQANGTQFIIYAEPRVYGITAGYHF